MVLKFVSCCKSQNFYQRHLEKYILLLVARRYIFFQLGSSIHFISSDKSEVQQQQEQQEEKPQHHQQEKADDSGKMPSNSHKRTVSEVCVSPWRR